MVELGGSEERDMWVRIEELAVELARTVDALKAEVVRAREEARRARSQYRE